MCAGIEKQSTNADSQCFVMTHAAADQPKRYSPMKSLRRTVTLVLFLGLGARLPAFENVAIYPLITELLGIPPAALIDACGGTAAVIGLPFPVRCPLSPVPR